MSGFGARWQAFSRRERLLIALAATLALAVLLWLAVLRPLAATRTAAEARLATATSDLAAVTAMAAAIRAAEARVPAGGDVPLPELAARRIAEAGLSAEPVQPLPDGGVALRIAAVRAPVLLAWLAARERDDALVIERARLRRNGDATIAADLVLRRR